MSLSEQVNRSQPNPSRELQNKAKCWHCKGWNTLRCANGHAAWCVDCNGPGECPWCDLDKENDR